MLQRVKNTIQQKINKYRYKYLAVSAEKPKYLQQQLTAEGYCSQFGQDKWIIEKLFPDKKKGFFVDIGANDGITLSNTYLLEKIGWDGIVVEPIPSVFEKLVQNRKSIAVNGCIAAKSGKELFRVIIGSAQMLSGLVGEYDSRHLERIKREIDSQKGEYNDIEINCYNFNELLESNGINQIDYLTIDIEGSEYKILNSIDFDRIHISVIGVENNYKDYRIPKFLIKKGFEFHSVLGDDDFYRNKSD